MKAQITFEQNLKTVKRNTETGNGTRYSLERGRDFCRGIRRCIEKLNSVGNFIEKFKGKSDTETVEELAMLRVRVVQILNKALKSESKA